MATSLYPIHQIPNQETIKTEIISNTYYKKKRRLKQISSGRFLLSRAQVSQYFPSRECLLLKFHFADKGLITIRSTLWRLFNFQMKILEIDQEQTLKKLSKNSTYQKQIS